MNWINSDILTPLRPSNPNCFGYWIVPIIDMAESVLIQKGEYNNTIDLSEEYILFCAPLSDCLSTPNMNFVFNLAEQGIPLDNEE